MSHYCGACGLKFTPRCIPCQEKQGGVKCPKCGRDAQPILNEATE